MHTPVPVSKSAVAKMRLAYFDDLTTLPVTNDLDKLVKGATARRAPLNDVRAMVANDECEVALLPTSEALRVPNMCIVPCSAVSILGASRLFMIFAKTMPTDIRRILVDQEDYGVLPLAQVLFQKKMMVRPEFVRSQTPLDPTTYNLAADDGFDGYLLAGKNAMMVRKEAFTFSWDLTLAWYEFARLPYVLHCWIAKKGLKLGKLDKEIADAARRNEMSIEIPTKSAERYAVSQSGIRAIYEKALFTGFEPNVVTGMRRFGQEVMQGRILQLQPITIYTEVATRRPVGA